MKPRAKVVVIGAGPYGLSTAAYLRAAGMEPHAPVAFGGCPRGELAYWREIWLRRDPEDASREAAADR